MARKANIAEANKESKKKSAHIPVGRERKEDAKAEEEKTLQEKKKKKG